MSQCPSENVDPIEFDYSPEQPLSADQRIELLEQQVSDLRHQLGALVDHIGGLAANPGN